MTTVSLVIGCTAVALVAIAIGLGALYLSKRQ